MRYDLIARYKCTCELKKLYLKGVFVVKSYVILFFMIFGIACRAESTENNQSIIQAVKFAARYHDGPLVIENRAETRTLRDIEKSTDTTLPLKFLATWRGFLDVIISTIEQAASECAPEQDLKESIKKLDQAVMNSVLNLDKLDLDVVKLPENIGKDVMSALFQGIMNMQQDVEQNPITNVDEYVELIKRMYTSMIGTVITALQEHYELSDEAVAVYAQPFGTQKSITEESITRNQDITVAVKYLERYRGGLDAIVAAIEKAASQVTPDQNIQEVLQRFDHVVVDTVHKIGNLDSIIVPEEVLNDIFEALSECQIDTQKDLMQNPIKNVSDYVAYMKRTYTAMLIATVSCLDEHYELTDEVIAPYVKAF